MLCLFLVKRIGFLVGKSFVPSSCWVGGGLVGVEILGIGTGVIEVNNWLSGREITKW